MNALDLLKDKPMVRNFLTMQREKGRPGSMRNILERLQQNASVRVSGASPVDTSVQSESSGEASIRSSEVSVDVSRTSSLSSISLSDSTKEKKKDPDYVSEVKEKAPPKKKKEELVDERIAGILDKCGTSGGSTRLQNQCVDGCQTTYGL